MRRRHMPFDDRGVADRVADERFRVAFVVTVTSTPGAGGWGT